MKTIVSALLALSVLAGVAATSAKAAEADYPEFGTSAWWNEQDAEHNYYDLSNEQTSPGVMRGSSSCSSRGPPSHR